MGLNAMELFPTAVRGTGYGIAAGTFLIIHLTYFPWVFTYIQRYSNG